MNGSVLMKFYAVAIVLLSALSATPAGAASSEGYGQGGWFEQFDPIVARYNQTGEEFRITGHCQSACTLFLAIRHVCIEPGATLLFHVGHNRNRTIAPGPTRHLLSAYNGKLRSYLLANHAMETLAFHEISGRDLIERFGYRQCPGR
jgi:hypothetical protein